MPDLLKQIRNAIRVSTPLIAIRTADPGGLVELIRAGEFYGVRGKKDGNAPLLQWDIVEGLRAIERDADKGAAEPSEKALRVALGDAEQATSTNPVESLRMIGKAPAATMAFWQNAHRYINDDPSVAQAIWNLRDILKAKMCTLIMLCPSITLPAELQQDVLILDEALPDDAQLTEIARRIHDEVQIAAPDAAMTERIVDATLGLASFPAEQSMAMSITPKGMDLDTLWERKRSIINGTPGLAVWNGGERFDDIGGCENVKTFLRAVITGNDSPRAVVWLDEIEKGIGTGQDTSGVSQGMLGQLLSWMQDNTATGCIFIGPPGAAKSAIAKATGNEAGVPTIGLDLGGLKGSLVGESEAKLRGALKVIDAVSQKRAIFLATCNSIAALPPELRRRFTFGTFFFPLPSKAERAIIWDLYIKKYKLDPEQERPNDVGWTGAEIRQNCELCYRLRRPLIQCATFIVPVSKSAGEQIERLCRDAHDKFIGASEPGLYQHRPEQPEAATVAAMGRRITFGEAIN